MKTKNLFNEFESISKTQWKEKVNIDLKGGDFSKLIWKTYNKSHFQPMYLKEDKIVPVENTHKNSLCLINYRTIFAKTDAEANQKAKQAINEGINGLVFETKLLNKPASVLEGIDLNVVAIAFNLSNKTINFGLELFQYLISERIEFQQIKGYINLQIIENYTINDEFEKETLENLSQLIMLSKDFPNFKTVNISSSSFLNAGCNQVQEIAFALNAVVFLIEKLKDYKISPQEVIDNLHLKLGIGSAYFLEIAKFRAIRSLTSLIFEKYQSSNLNCPILAETVLWNKSAIDKETNLLRSTTEAMSAILGNVDALEIQAFDSVLNKNHEFSKRIAGNITTILTEEAYFNKVTNPTDGSYYIEEITSKIAEEALELFKYIEDKGGFYQAFEGEIIQQLISETNSKKLQNLAFRKNTLVGINKYPNLLENVDFSLLPTISRNTNKKLLTPIRASEKFETIRNNTAKLISQFNYKPKIERISFGDFAMRKARAAFAFDFLGLSGFTMLPDKSFEKIDEAISYATKSDSDVFVLCSSDNDYEKLADTFISKLKAHNKDKIVLLAGNTKNISSNLYEVGLDSEIHLKSNAIEIISWLLNKIEKNLKSVEA